MLSRVPGLTPAVPECSPHDGRVALDGHPESLPEQSQKLAAASARHAVDITQLVIHPLVIFADVGAAVLDRDLVPVAVDVELVAVEDLLEGAEPSLVLVADDVVNL